MASSLGRNGASGGRSGGNVWRGGRGRIEQGLGILLDSLDSVNSLAFALVDSTVRPRFAFAVAVFEVGFEVAAEFVKVEFGYEV